MDGSLIAIMSCHNLGFSPHDKEALGRALAKQDLSCTGCNKPINVLTDEARVIDHTIIFHVYCNYCDKTSVRSISYYSPKDV